MSAPLVLASGSAIRRQILKNAGVPFDVQRPDVDEDEIKAARASESTEAVAQDLADEKALTVSRARPEVCLAADQILRFDGRRFDKPKSRVELVHRLMDMQNRAHELVGAVTLARGGHILDRYLEVSRLAMRPMTRHEIDAYLDEAGPKVLSSVGGYQFEGRGARLFEWVDGDYFAILGLPLLPVLAMLRRHGVIDGSVA